MYSERTLMISGSEKGLDSVTSFLKACGCGSVAVISSGSEARRMIPHDDFDLILINTPLKDEFGHTAGAYFIQKALLDGNEQQEISHQDLLEAQVLQFDLSWLPPHP